MESTIASVLGFILLDLYVFFILYVASMAMIRAHAEEKLNGVLWVLCVPFVAFALAVDILHNLTLFSLIFWEVPKELTVTDRLKRHIDEKYWRGGLARWMATTLLNSFDHTGNHVD